MALPNIASLNTYGTPKVNVYAPEDPTTDESATDRNAYVADVAGMTQTVDRAWVRFIGVASNPVTDPGSNVHGAVWGNGASVKPAVSRTGVGVYTITWPSTITDENANVVAVNLRTCKVNVEGTVPYQDTATVTAPNVVTVRIFTSAGVADNGVGVTFAVYAA